MATTQNQQKKKSTTDYANSAVNTVQTARKAVMIAQKAQAFVSFIAATWEVWAVVIGIIILVALFLTIITAIMGQGNSPAPTPQPAPPPTQGQNQTLTCTTDYATCLKDDFNVVVTGTYPSDGLQTIFNILAAAGESSIYTELLTCKGGTLTINITTCTSNCISRTSANLITLSGFFVSHLSFGSQENLLIHESGHVIYARNCNRVQQLYHYQYDTLVSQDGNTCYDDGYLKSYALRGGFRICNLPPNGINISPSFPEHESFAEAIADYVTYKTYTNPTGFRCSQSLKNTYNSACQQTYTWVGTNIFGGTQF